MDAASAGPVKLTGEKIVYGGLNGEFTGIHIVNLLLTLVTAGIFRFWARTRERRYVWGHTALLGDWFEYSGTGKELFIGFLKALVVFGALFGVFYLGGWLAVLFAADLAQAQILTPLFSLPGYALVLYLTHFGAFSARRYRMSRTFWRGIRFEQRGSPVTYANRAFVGFLACVLTLGLYFPYYALRLRAYELDNLHFGTLSFHFEANPRALWRPFLLAWVIGAAFVLGIAALFGPAYWTILQYAPNPVPPEEFPRVLALLPLAVLAGYIVLPLAWAGFSAAMMRHIAASTSLGGLRFACAATGWRLFRLWLGNTLIVMFTLSLLRPVAINRSMRFFARHYAIDGEVDLVTIGAAAAGPRSGEGLAGYFDLDALPG
ncbi:YjgN family protein [Desertibaculum subflavum]|uniref:YjgN family protein n=1 Tax=Desertibaculum subflavum TaxID=2268458 RepID=UPI000E66D454